MKTSNISVISSAIVFAMIAPLVISITAPANVNAAAIAGSTKFADVNDCNAKISKHTNAEIQTYTKARVASREKTLDNTDKFVDKVYASKQKRVDTWEAKYKKNAKKASGVDVSFIAKDKSDIKKLISDTRGSLKTKAKAVESSSSATTSASNVCSIIYDLRVNTYVRGKAQWLHQIDATRTSIAVNKIRKMDTLNTYEAKKARYVSPSTAQATVAKLPDTNQFDTQFNQLVSDLLKIEPKSINAATPPKAFEEYKAFAPGALKLLTDANAQTGTISQVRKDLAKEKLKPVAKKKKTKKSSSGQSSSNGGVSAP